MWITEFAFDPPDDPERLALRPQHRDRLKAHHANGVVVLAGAFADGSGSMVLWEAQDEPAVRTWLAEDPYYAVPSVTVVAVRAWDTLPL